MYGFSPPQRGAGASGPADAATADAVKNLLREARSEAAGGEEAQGPAGTGAPSASPEEPKQAPRNEAAEGQREPAAAAEADPKEASAPAAGELSPGLAVRLVGLQSKPELNGQRGRLVAFDEGKGRWQVKLKDGTKLLKADNLESCGAEEDKRKPAPQAPPARQRRALPTEPLSPEEAVDWIERACDEFEVLLLPMQLEEDPGKIRKQYRQLSLLVHPDKNPHPAASSAFKKLFGAMQTLSDPMEQRVALRRARQRATGVDSGPDEGVRWWEAASVDEMERAFRDMEQKYDKMGFFDIDRRVLAGRTGVDEDQLWASPELGRDLLQKDLAIFLDSRNTTDFDVSHVRGAHSLPGHTMDQLVNIEMTPAFRLVMGNPEQTVIVYSDNGSKLSRCVNVARALRTSPRILAQRVLRLSGGLNLWKRNGFPVDGDTRALFAGQVLGDSMMRLGPGPS